MKTIHYIFIATMLLINFSCRKELTTDGVSKVTTYVTFNLTGGPTMIFPPGDSLC